LIGTRVIVFLHTPVPCQLCFGGGGGVISKTGD
jgi:hypothetical protein